MKVSLHNPFFGTTAGGGLGGGGYWMLMLFGLLGIGEKEKEPYSNVKHKSTCKTNQKKVLFYFPVERLIIHQSENVILLFLY